MHVLVVINSYKLGRWAQPTAWMIATDGSASPPSLDLPATAGWVFLVHWVGLLSGLELECCLGGSFG